MTIQEAAALAGEQLREPEPFRRWLREHGRGATVGYTMQPGACPISRFLDDALPEGWGAKTDYFRASVFRIGSSVERDVPATAWVREFASRIDNVARGTPVSKERAHRVLARALQEASFG